MEKKQAQTEQAQTKSRERVRVHRVLLALTDAELELLQTKAEALGLHIGTFARMTLFQTLTQPEAESQ